MAHHAFVVSGSSTETTEQARTYAMQHLSITESNNSDILTLHFGLFSVDDARKIASLAYQSAAGEGKVIMFYAARIFHEAQNALLKIFEEPPQGVTLIIGVPSIGILLPTLRSRLMPLPASESTLVAQSSASTFLSLKEGEREKYVTKLVDRSKSDKEEVKQAARAEATELLQTLISYSHNQLVTEKEGMKREQTLLFLQDLASFMPLMFERSAPLKLIFEHLLLIIPTSLKNPKV